MYKWVLAIISLFVFAMLLTGCSGNKSYTTSYIQIIDKGITGDKYWVTAFDPNSKQHQEFKVVVHNENVWNLIEEEAEYFATYEYTSLSDGADLESIKHPDLP